MGDIDVWNKIKNKENSMKKKTISFLLLCALLAVPALAHDLFLKLDNFFVAVNEKLRLAF